MPYWRLFYHLVWATKDRAPLLGVEATEVLQRTIRAAAGESKAIVHAVGVMPDHVHVALSIPPSVAISSVVGRMKGSSSHLLGHDERGPRIAGFAWQAEYGVLSCGERALADVVAYVHSQEDRHAARRVWPALERFDGGNVVDSGKRISPAPPIASSATQPA